MSKIDLIQLKFHDMVRLEFTDFILTSKQHEIIIKDDDYNEICTLKLNRENVLMMSKADELFQMVDTLVNCIEHRDVAGEGVAEFWVKEAKKLMGEVRGV